LSRLEVQDPRHHRASSLDQRSNAHSRSCSQTLHGAPVVACNSYSDDR
jgi:hypothetical protein